MCGLPVDSRSLFASFWILLLDVLFGCNRDFTFGLAWLWFVIYGCVCCWLCVIVVVFCVGCGGVVDVFMFSMVLRWLGGWL